MKRFYLMHPVRGNVEKNLYQAKLWVKHLQGRFPDINIIAPWIYECEIYDDSDDAQRASGMNRNFSTIEGCHGGIAVTNSLTTGMVEEIQHHRKCSLPVYRMINFGDELKVYNV